MNAILFVALCLGQADEKSRQKAGDSQEPPLAKVSVFRREATFVAKDRQLRFLDVTQPGEPKPVFRLNWIGDLNVQIALAEEDGNVIVTDGKTIFQVDEQGRSTKLAAITDFRVEAAGEEEAEERQGASRSINWYFATSNSRKFLYLVVHGGSSTQLGRLELSSRKFRTIAIPFPTGIDVDPESGVAYVPEFSTPRIMVRDFDGKVNDRLVVSNKAYFCKLSPDRKRLLLSNLNEAPGSAMALIDLKTGTETVLPVEGSCAAWGDDETVYFLRGSNSLWRYRPGDGEATELMTTPGMSVVGYSLPPQLSLDGTWLAWRWTAQRDRNLEHATILIDLKNREYRTLTGWWYNTQWITKRGSGAAP